MGEFKSGKADGRKKEEQRFQKAKTSILIVSTLLTLRHQRWKRPGGLSRLSALATHCLESL